MKTIFAGLLVLVSCNPVFAGPTFSKSYCSPINMKVAMGYAEQFANDECGNSKAVRVGQWTTWNETSVCGNPDCVPNELQHCASAAFTCAE